jgi:hypothetical protein
VFDSHGSNTHSDFKINCTNRSCKMLTFLTSSVNWLAVHRTNCDVKINQDYSTYFVRLCFLTPKTVDGYYIFQQDLTPTVVQGKQTQQWLARLIWQPFFNPTVILGYTVLRVIRQEKIYEKNHNFVSKSFVFRKCSALLY